jgi:phage tail sheath protein FI
MSEPVAGVKSLWDHAGEIRPTQPEDFSTIFNIGPAPNKAEGLEFDRCYTVNTSDTEFWTAVGAGPVQDQARAAAKSLRNGDAAHNMTVVLTKEGTDSDPVNKRNETIANIAGDPLTGKGMYAAKLATAHNAKPARLYTIAGGFSGPMADNSANPAVQAMANVCGSMYGFGFFEGPNSTKAAAIAVRELYGSRHLHLIETGAYDYNAAGTEVLYGASGYIAGLQATVDRQHGGVPSHCAGAHEVLVSKPGREIGFTYDDGSYEGQQLLAAQIGFLTRGDANNAFAAGQGGCIYMGAHTCSSEPLEQFINVSRMQDYMSFMTMKAMVPFVLKYNMESSTVLRSALKTAESVLLGLANNNHIYANPRVEFIPDSTTPEDWRLGHFKIHSWAEPHAPLMKVTNTLHRDRNAIVIAARELEAFSSTFSI